MAVSAADIARTRALSAAPVADYSDAAISAIIALYPKYDSTGLAPDDEDWTETYDLYRAAADIADQRAAAVATLYDVSADGAGLSRSQVQAQLYALGTRLRSRASAVLTRALIEDTNTTDDDDEEGNG